MAFPYFLKLNHLFMEKSDYTPGPWEITTRCDNETQVHIAWTDVCEIVAPRPVTQSITQDKANAKLIATAPDLLEALQELVHLHGCEQEGIGSGQPTFQQWIDAVNKASEAIDKAIK
jgi:hypothetical protein